MQCYLEEDAFVLKQITKKNARILDVGCGEGRYLVPLSRSHQVVGIDVNKEVIAELTAKGLNAIHVDRLAEIKMKYDYIIMSHFLEHLFPLEMLELVDLYLDMLKDDGELIIATPFLYNEFYDDFDHVKPYTPKAVALLFSDYAQHQKKPRNRLELRRVWIRKWPHVFSSYPGENVTKQLVKGFLNKIMGVIFFVSFKSISRSTGWVGVFGKVPIATSETL